LTLSLKSVRWRFSFSYNWTEVSRTLFLRT